MLNQLPVINVSTCNATICIGQSATLSASAATAYTWNTSAASESIVINPTITTNYTVTGVAANGCSKSFSFSQEVSECTGVNELKVTDASLQIYPNPNNGEFTIVSSSDMKLVIINELGQLVKTLNVNANTAEKVSVSELSNGIYFAIGQNSNQVIKQKIIVSK